MKTLLLISLFAFSFVYADIKDETLEFTSGEITTWKSKGHKKAKGVDVKISIPKSWENVEGNRPNILQKFSPKRKSSHTRIALQTIDVGEQLAEEDIAEMNTKEFCSLIIGEEAEILSHQATKLNGVDCSMFEYTLTQEQLGVKIGLKILGFMIPQGKTILFVACSAGGNATSGYDQINKRYSESKLLFVSIVNSFVFEGRWK